MVANAAVALTAHEEARERALQVGGELAWKPAGPAGGQWREAARRMGPLPASLFEVIRFKDPELAH